METVIGKRHMKEHTEVPSPPNKRSMHDTHEGDITMEDNIDSEDQDKEDDSSIEDKDAQEDCLADNDS